MPEPQPSPEAQVIAIRAALIDTYGEDYAGEDAGAEVERLFRHLAEHEADVQRIRQAKNEALERAQAQVAALQRELAEAREVEIALNARKTAAILEAMERAEQAEADREEEARSAVSLRRERDALKAELAEARAAMQHFAAEAHRRKWAHENSSPAAFEVLHRLGNELIAAMKAAESHGGGRTPQALGTGEGQEAGEAQEARDDR